MGTYGTLQEGYPVILEIMLPTKMPAQHIDPKVVAVTARAIAAITENLFGRSELT